MALPTRRRKLNCHYCNQKSNNIYDGQITKWECNKCDATNYLDENGEITDPPVAEISPAASVRYATNSSESSLPSSRKNIFCARCLKNQHLYTSSLAQYHVEVDTDSFEIEKKNGAYYRFRKDLETRYPQVCQDCEPAALQQMRQAGKTAKADHLRRLMDKTRESRSKLVKPPVLTLANVGEIIWDFGLGGQLMWNFGTILSSILETRSTLSITPSISLRKLELLLMPTCSRSMAHITLICTILSSWWSPKYSEASRGFTRHIHGFKSWYQLQVITIFLRYLFYYMMGTQFFSEQLSPITAAAHSVMAILTTLISIKAKRSLKINMAPLWKNVPEKLATSKSRIRSCENEESMGDILEQISSESYRSNNVNSVNLRNSSSSLSSKLTQASSSSVSAHHTYSRPDNLFFSQKSNSQLARSSFELAPRENINSDTVVSFRSTPSLLNMSEKEATYYLKTGEWPKHLQDQYHQPDYEEMDWQSTQSQSINFNPRPKMPPQQPVKSQAQDRPPTFWYKLPPAPQTPAQKIISQPSKFSGQLPSKPNTEQFNPTLSRDTRKQSISVPVQFQDTVTQHKPSKLGIEFSPQKFFPPEPPGEAEKLLADLLTDFSLTNIEDEKNNLNQTQRIIYIVTFLVLVISIIYAWYTHR